MTTTSKFQPGDRVRVLADAFDSKVGQTGTVTMLGSTPGVVWAQMDTPTTYAALGPKGHGRAGFMDCLAANNLALIKEVEPTEEVPAVIAALAEPNPDHNPGVRPGVRPGDRVQLISNVNYSDAGQTGTVTETLGSISWVEFDTATRFIGLASSGKGRSGFMDCVVNSALQVIDPSPADAQGYTAGPVSDGGMDPRTEPPATGKIALSDTPEAIAEHRDRLLETWQAICGALELAVPDFLQQPGTGTQNAVDAIRLLAEKATQCHEAQDAASIIRPGDVVRLKSGGPMMTVTAVSPSEAADCGWFGPAGERDAATFATIALTKGEQS